MNALIKQSFVAMAVLSFGISVIAQEDPNSLAIGEIPRTEFGQPDMQGVWFYGTSTPWERDVALGNQQSFSEDEAEQMMLMLESAEQAKEQPLSRNLQVLAGVFARTSILW